MAIALLEAKKNTLSPDLVWDDKKHITQQSVDAAIWSICDIMRPGRL